MRPCKFSEAFCSGCWPCTSQHMSMECRKTARIPRLEFGFAFVSDRGQVSGVSEREECQLHARIERADEQLFGRPDVRPASELRRAANHDARSSHCESIPRRASSRASAWGRNRRSVVHVPRGRGQDRPSSQGIIACCSERRRNNPRMYVLICNSYDSSLQNYVAIVRRRWFWSNHD